MKKIMLFKKTPALSYQFPLIVACPLQLPKPKVKSVFPFESKVRSTFIPVLLLMPMHPSQQMPSLQQGVGKHC